MTTSQQNIDYLSRRTELLLDSCEIYSEIISLYQKLESNISSSAQLLTDIIKQLCSRQALAKNIDDSIKSTLNRNTNLTSEDEALLKRREALLQDILIRNKTITHKASAIKSHLQYEVSSINTNRHAINGYRIPEAKNRNLINNKF